MLLERYDQVIIYGARGWVGRSAIHTLLQGNKSLVADGVIAIGSRSESPLDSGLPFHIYSSKDLKPLLKKNILFLNAAYLRREKLLELKQSEYIAKNIEIMEFPKKLLLEKRIKTFINLSSGVVANVNLKHVNDIQDPYTRMKVIDEQEIMKLCMSSNTNLINCRIFSMSGKFLNEFRHLALSSFILQAKQLDRPIEVRSPKTLRSYIDSIDLVNVLLLLTLEERDFWIDSGGTLIQLGDLADFISSRYSGSSVIKEFKSKKSDDYFGNLSEFNQLARSRGVHLLSIQEQINQTIRAFI